MLLLKETVKHESKAHPGVSFNVRVLSVIERLRRDADIAPARQRLREIGAEAVENASNPESLDEEAMRILTTEMVPFYIRHGLVSIEGVGDENEQTPSVDVIIRLAPATLLMELFFACRDAGGIDEQTEKNLQRSGTFPAVVDGAMTPMTAGTANGTGTTELATAPSTSLTQ